jgi:catechol 2,3-dioxygenase-like lactoylglutathione lyase family enzyme
LGEIRENKRSLPTYITLYAFVSFTDRVTALLQNTTFMSIRQIKETCLYVTDLDRTAAFYHGQLGLPVISHVEGRHVFFRAGTSVLLCFIAGKTKEEKILPPHHGSGQLHMAFEVARADYEIWKEKVREAGIAVIHEEPWKGNYHSFYFHDPDGHVLEIVPEGMWGQG